MLLATILALHAEARNLLAAAAAATPPKIPQSLADVVLSFIQDHIGNVPLAMYLATWFGTFAVAAFAALQIRGALAKDWNAVSAWRDQIIVVVQSTASSAKTGIERGDHGSIALYKGRVLLAWPDEATLPLVKLNTMCLSVAEWGSLYDRATVALCGVVGFITFFALHLMVLLALLAFDRAKLFDQGYIPHMQAWLGLIFLWPAALYLLQHTLLPTWFGQLNRSKADLVKLSEQFGFANSDVKVGG